MTFRILQVTLISLIGVAITANSAVADKFTLTGRRGETIEVEARLAGSGQGTTALELASGRYLLVPEAAIEDRVKGDDPTPLTAKQMEAELREEFGEDRFFSHVAQPYVVGFILERPLQNKQQEVRAKALLKKAYAFMRSVQGMFLKFTRSVRVKAKPAKFPLIILIFETDRSFEAYAS